MLTIQEVIAWHRNQAKLHADVADKLEGKVVTPAVAETTRKPKALESKKPKEPVNNIPQTSLTAEMLEARVKEKSGRVKDFATYFHVTEDTINALISSPESKVYGGDRGWLKIRE